MDERACRGVSGRTRRRWRVATGLAMAGLAAVGVAQADATTRFGNGVPDQATVTARPGPEVTRTPEPTAETREFEGLYSSAFERSVFVEGTSRCPTGGWWMVLDRASTVR